MSGASPGEGATDGSQFIGIRSRGCFGTLVSGGCGCFAFIVGAGLAVAVAAPQLLSGWGARLVQGIIQSEIDGTVEVEDVELSWGKPQRARSVVLRSPDGDEVARGSLKLPSLLELIGGKGGEREYRVEISTLRAQFDADGTTDLGRTFGLDADDGRSSVEALIDSAIRVVARDRGAKSATPSRRLTFVVNEAQFVGPDASSEAVLVENLIVVATSNRVGATLDVREGVVSGAGIDGRASVRFKAHFSHDSADTGMGEVLTSLAADVDPIPLASLRKIGLVSRRSGADGDSSANGVAAGGAGDGHLAVGRWLESSAESFFGEGARLTVRYGTPQGATSRSTNAEVAIATPALPAVPTTGSDRPLVIDAAGPRGQIHVSALYRDGALIAQGATGGDPAFHGNFELRPGALAEAFGALVPEGVTVTQGEQGAPWRVECRDFRIPLPEDALTLESPRSTRAAMSTTETAGVGPWLADRLRTANLFMGIRSTSDASPRLAFLPVAGDGAAEPGLDWEHRLTTVKLRGELGGEIETHWRVDQAEGERARLEVTLPTAPLGSFDRPATLLSMSVPAVPQGLLATVAPLPKDLVQLLPQRIHRLEVTGLPILEASPVDRTRRTLGVRIWASREGFFEGRFDDGVFSCPRSRVSIELNDASCQAIFERLLPWFEDVQPTEAGGSLVLDLQDFEFEVGASELRESANVKITSDPIRVRLRRDLAGDLSIEDPDEWIEWTPAPIELSLERNVIRYRKLELPLSDEYVGSVTGRFDRLDQAYMLTGVLDSGLFPGLDSAPSLVRVVISGHEEGADVTLSTDDLKKALEDLVERAGG